MCYLWLEVLKQVEVVGWWGLRDGDVYVGQVGYFGGIGKIEMSFRRWEFFF